MKVLVRTDCEIQPYSLECGCLFVFLVVLCFAVVMNYHPRHFVLIVMLPSSLKNENVDHH